MSDSSNEYKVPRAQKARQMAKEITYSGGRTPLSGYPTPSAPTLEAETPPPAPEARLQAYSDQVTKTMQAGVKDGIRLLKQCRRTDLANQVGYMRARLNGALWAKENLQRDLAVAEARATSAEERATAPSPFQITRSDLYQNLQLEYFQMKQRAEAAEERATRAEAALAEATEGARQVIRREIEAQMRADKAERAIDDERERATKADAKRQRARQHAIQVVGQCLSGGDSQLAADALFNMIGLLYDEADDKQLYPPMSDEAGSTPPREKGGQDA
jgi:hypothetical protein